MQRSALPVTGTSSALIALAAFVSIAVGSVLVVRARRSGIAVAVIVATAAMVFAFVGAPRASAAADCTNQSPVVPTTALVSTTTSAPTITLVLTNTTSPVTTHGPGHNHGRPGDHHHDPATTTIEVFIIINNT